MCMYEAEEAEDSPLITYAAAACDLQWTLARGEI